VTTTFSMESFAFSEIDYVIMLFMTACLGWRIAEVARRHFCQNTQGPKNLSVKKLTKVTDTTATPPPAPKRASPVGTKAAGSPKSSMRIPPTQGLAVSKQAGLTEPSPAPIGVLRPSRPWNDKRTVASEAASAAPVLPLPPPGLEQFSSQSQVLPATAAAVNKSWAQMLAHSMAAPAMPAPTVKSPAARTATAAPASTAPSVERQLGRVVCWKDTGYGFVVDEAGERLFVRQGDVEGGEQLRAGQLVWFRRGRPQGKTATKAVDVTLVSAEASRVLRQSAQKQSQKLQSGSADDAADTPTNKALMYSPLKSSGKVGVEEKVCGNKDADLSAFLGSGPTDEIDEKVPEAPQ